MNTEAVARLYNMICYLFPPGPKRQRWLQWAIQLEDSPATPVQDCLGCPAGVGYSGGRLVAGNFSASSQPAMHDKERWRCSAAQSPPFRSCRTQRSFRLAGHAVAAWTHRAGRRRQNRRHASGA